MLWELVAALCAGVFAGAANAIARNVAELYVERMALNLKSV